MKPIKQPFIKDFKTYQQCLADEILNLVEKMIKNQTFNGLLIDCTNRCKICFSKQMARMMMEGMAKPKYQQITPEHKRFLGYHIFNGRFVTIRLNKLAGEFNYVNQFFERAENSTYHRNNGITYKNGYSHWYEPQDCFYRAKSAADIKYANQINHLTKYKTPYELKRCIPNKSVTTDTHFRIKKSIYTAEFRKFCEFKNDAFCTVLKNTAFCTETHVYVKNETKYDSESLNGLGRQYTVLGSLPKLLRKRILKGYFEVDLECGVQSVLMNLFKLDTVKYPYVLTNTKNDFPMTNELLRDKQLFRCFVGCHVGPNNAKAAITQLYMAPNSNITWKYRNTTIRQKVGAKKMFKKIRKESNILRNSALNMCVDDVKNPNYKFNELKIGDMKNLIETEIKVNNLNLPGGGRGKERAARKLFRVYELIEHQIRKLMKEFYSINGSKEIYQIHDCLIMPTIKSHTKELCKFIKNKLNFDISFEVQRYA